MSGPAHDKAIVYNAIGKFVAGRDEISIGALSRHVIETTGLAFGGPTIATMLKQLGFKKRSASSSAGTWYERVGRRVDTSAQRQVAL